MNIWNKLKGAFEGKSKKSKFAWTALLILVLIGAVLSFRSCGSKMHKKRYFTIGRDSSWYPIELAGKEKNLTAFTNDLFSFIAKENNIHLEWYETAPLSLVYGLENEEYDFILSTIRPNFINKEKYDFSSPIFEYGYVLLVRQDSNISSLKEMKGRSIGVGYGFSWADNAQNLSHEDIRELYYTTYGNTSNALDDLVNNKIDGVIMQSMPAYTASQGLYAGKIKIVTPPFNDEGLRIVALKNSPYTKVITNTDESIKKMRENGTYQSLIAKWTLVDPATHYWKPPQDKEK